MKIETKAANPNLTPCGYIKPGQMFRYDETIYIKLQDCYSVNAVELADGTAIEILPSVRVELVDATLVISN